MKATTDTFFARSCRERKGKSERLTILNSAAGDIVVEKTYRRPITILEFAPSGQHLVVVAGDLLEVYDTQTGYVIDSRTVGSVKSLQSFEPGSERRLFTLNLELNYEGRSYMTIPVMRPEVKQ